SAVLPDLLTGDTVEAIKLVTAETTADEYFALHDCGSCQRPAARERHLPTDDLAVLSLKRFRRRDFNRRRTALFLDLLNSLGNQVATENGTYCAGQEKPPRETQLVHCWLQ